MMEIVTSGGPTTAGFEDIADGGFTGAATIRAEVVLVGVVSENVIGNRPPVFESSTCERAFNVLGYY